MIRLLSTFAIFALRANIGCGSAKSKQALLLLSPFTIFAKNLDLGDMDSFMEIFTLVTGVIFLILEIRQNNLMWILQFITGVTSVYVFLNQGLYAAMGLNVYYVVIAFWGFVRWRKDAIVMKNAASGQDATDTSGNMVHLRHLTTSVIIWSSVALIAGTIAFMYILRLLDDPMSGLDACAAILSVIATLWLAKSYKELWVLWIIVNVMTSIMCAAQGLCWMTLLYVFYTISSVYGYYHWNKNGVYIENDDIRN